MLETDVGYRLSPLQRHAWQGRGTGTGYSAAVFALDAPLTPDALAARLQRLAAELEILRVELVQVDGLREPVQYVRETARCHVVAGRLATEAEADADVDTLVDAWLDCSASRQANLAVALLDAATGPRHLLLRAPTWIADDAALALLAQALAASEPFVADTQYIDIAEWMHDVLESPVAEAGRAFWSSLNADAAHAARLPFARHAASSSVTPARRNYRVESGVTGPVEPELQALLAWHGVLSRWCGVGALDLTLFDHGRRFDELATVIGPVARAIPLRCDTCGLTAADSAARMADALAQARRHQEYFDPALPLPVHGYQWRTSGGNGGARWRGDSGLAIMPGQLVLRAGIDAGAWMLEFVFDARCFSAADIDVLAEQMRSALLQAPLAGYTPLCGPAVTPARPVSADALFDACVAGFPHAPAVRSGQTVLDYAALDHQVGRIADALLDLGVRHGDRIALVLPRDAACIAAMLAALRCGVAYVPLDPDAPTQRLADILAEASPRVLVHAGATDRWASLDGMATLDVTRLPARAEAAVRPSRIAVDPLQIAYVIYTSGSTGRPKGVEVSHQAVCHYVQAIEQRLGLEASASLSALSTWTADLGYTALYGALLTGRCFDIVPSDTVLDPARLSLHLAQYPVDCLKIVPSHLAALLEVPGGEAVLPRQCLVLGGEAAAPALLARLRERRPDLRVVNHYGPTETTIGVATHEAQGAPHHAGLPIGRALGHLRLHVLDAQLQPCPVGVIGELYIAGAGVAQGYLSRPDLTAERFLPEPVSGEDAPGTRMYRSGDRARYWPNGALQLLGRADDQVKIRGHRVEPGEVAAVLGRLPGVGAAVVVAQEAGADAWLAAYLVPTGVVRPGDAALLAQLHTCLPAHMVPSALVWMQQLPVTANGKVDRRALPPASRQRGSGRAVVAPRTSREHDIAAIWTALLGVDEVSVEDNFFDCGGHSLLLVQLKARLDAAFGREMPIVTLFQATTIAAQARFYDASSAPATGQGASTAEHDMARRAEKARAALQRQREVRTDG
ncbi:non-ribosomal peptide synthetase [Stenotrophomonas sp. NPDC077461]|uniref:non-ribosomal peptide synthetase n=1 Tax=Stenotrophomonas sp. NPDC077461 TaxID=3414698 RepID=UPI003C2F44D5